MNGGNAKAGAVTSAQTASQATATPAAQGGPHFLLVQTFQEPPAWVLGCRPDTGIRHVDLAGSRVTGRAGFSSLCFFFFIELGPQKMKWNIKVELGFLAHRQFITRISNWNVHFTRSENSKNS